MADRKLEFLEQLNQKGTTSLRFNQGKRCCSWAPKCTPVPVFDSFYFFTLFFLFLCCTMRYVGNIFQKIICVCVKTKAKKQWALNILLSMLSAEYRERNNVRAHTSLHSSPSADAHVCMDIATPWACSFSTVSHMLWRSRPRSQATVCRWSRYLCRGTWSPSHQLPRVGPLGSTGMVRNRLGCGNVGHKIIFTSPQQGPVVNTDKRSGAHNCKRTHARYTLMVHNYSVRKSFFCAGEQ